MKRNLVLSALSLTVAMTATVSTVYAGQKSNRGFEQTAMSNISVTQPTPQSEINNNIESGAFAKSIKGMTDEFKAELDEMRKRYAEAKESLEKLTEEQKEEIDAIKAEIKEVSDTLIDAYVDCGLIDEEAAVSLREHKSMDTDIDFIAPPEISSFSIMDENAGEAGIVHGERRSFSGSISNEDGVLTFRFGEGDEESFSIQLPDGEERSFSIATDGKRGFHLYGDLTDEQKAQIEGRRTELKDKLIEFDVSMPENIEFGMQNYSEAWIALSDEQRENVYELYGHLIDLQKKLIDKYAEFGVYSTEMADKMKTSADEGFSRMKEHNIPPMIPVKIQRGITENAEFDTSDEKKSKIETMSLLTV